MADLTAMMALALDAKARAYAPYSRFSVGACIRADSGALYAGCNVENAAYPQGQCAEASAIGAMVAGGDRRIVEILIVGDGEALCAPCGGCRQRLNEFAIGDMKVHMANAGGIRQTATLAELLPLAFGPHNLTP